LFNIKGHGTSYSAVVKFQLLNIKKDMALDFMIIKLELLYKKEERLLL
jgi:hypothetical protein